MKEIVGDEFAFRCGERLKRLDDQDCYAVMAAPVPSLPSPSHQATSDGELVENCAIVAAQVVDGMWQWMHLQPDTKRVLTNLLLDNAMEQGRWWGMVVEKLNTAKEEP